MFFNPLFLICFWGAKNYCPGRISTAFLSSIYDDSKQISTSASGRCLCQQPVKFSITDYTGSTSYFFNRILYLYLCSLQ